MKYLALDFETGGLDPNRHGAVSLAVAAFDGGELLGSIEWTIKPPTKKDGKISLEYDLCAMQIHGVKWSDIKNGTPEAVVLNELAKWADSHALRDGLIVSHNAVFDASFLSQMVFRCGSWNYGKYERFPEPLYGPWACTRRMADPLGLPDNKLDTVAAHFGLSRTTELHGAKEDAILCGRIFGLLNKAEVYA